MPNKRYAKQTLLALVKDYVGEPISYGQVVQEQGRPIVYEDSVKAGNEALSLAASTLWRWVGWLASLGETVRAASSLIVRKEPASALHRESWLVAEHKFRRDQRRRTLQLAAQAIVVNELYRQLFDEEIFPNLATVYAWR